MLQKYFGESTLLRTQVFEWHKAFSESREVVENLPHAKYLPPESISFIESKRSGRSYNTLNLSKH